MSLLAYTGAPVAICAAARTLPNPPTGDGANVEAWTRGDGWAVEELEVTILAGAEVELADGVMLVAEEVHDTYPEESIAVTCTNATEIINLASHGFYTGDGPIRLTAAAIPTGLSETVEYWVIRASANTLQLAETRALALAGTEKTFSTDGTTVFLHWVTGTKSLSVNASAVTLADETFTIVDHGFEGGERVQVATTNTLPTGLLVDTDYYVRVVDEDTISFAATAGGAVLPLSGSPSGTQSVIYSDAGPTEATVYSLFKELNDGYAIVLDGDITFRERITHRPEVVAYHLVATLDRFVPITAYVRGIRWDE